jgi:23S rRNA (cytosine1962-C5)-methyltransferase
VKREIKRGVKYDGIIMDPPRFGRGMKGEVWKLLENLPELVTACREIISSAPLFWLINAYTADMSSLVLENLLADVTKDLKGEIENGELGIKETTSGRILPAGIFARWKA